MMDSYTFLQGNFGTESSLMFQKAVSFATCSYFQYVPSLSDHERTIVLLVSDRICFQTRDHDENYMSLLSNTVQLLSTDNILPPSPPRLLLSLFDSWLLLLLHYFVPGCEASHPHWMINMTSNYCLQSGAISILSFWAL